MTDHLADAGKPMPAALRLAELFELFAIDHEPDGWPGVRQAELNEAAAELRRLHAELQRLQGETRVMRGLLRQCAEVLCAVEPKSDTEGEELYALLHAIQGVIEPKAEGALL